VVRGFTTKETLLGCGVVTVAAVVVLGIGYRMMRKNGEDELAGCMAKVYVALSMYSESYDGTFPPNLLAIGPNLSSPDDLTLPGDPYVSAAGPFPNDGSLPGGPRKASTRVSFSYLWDFPIAKEMKKQPPGLLADEWGGEVEATGDFGANVAGPVVRINSDGALAKTTARTQEPLGSFRSLFGGQQ